MESVTELLEQHGAWVLFGGVLAEQLGLPFPALPLLVAAGVLVGTGHLSWSGALIAALSATLLADIVWFLAGRWRGRPVLTLLCRIALEPDACVRRTEDFFRKHGVQSLLVAKFIPGLSTISTVRTCVSCCSWLSLAKSIAVSAARILSRRAVSIGASSGLRCVGQMPPTRAKASSAST